MHSVAEHYIHNHIVYTAADCDSVVNKSCGVERSESSVEGLLLSHSQRLLCPRNGMASSHCISFFLLNIKVPTKKTCTGFL